MGAKPPKIMRWPSNGMFAPICFMRGSLIIFSLAASRAARLVGIFEPGEHDDLIRLGLHRALEIGELAVGHAVAPGLDHAGCAELLEHRRGVGGVLAKGFLVRGRNRDDKSFDIAHGFSPRWVDVDSAAAKIR